LSVAKPIGLIVILLAGACVSVPAGKGSREAEKAPIRGGVLEFQVASYDGAEVKGRVLVGATVDPLMIDGRLRDLWDVELSNLRECGKTEFLAVSALESFYPPRRPDQLIMLRPGYWYAGNVSFMLLFDSAKKGLGPECFEAELVALDINSRVVAKLPIRVVQTDKPPAWLVGGGKTEPKPPPSDAGTP